MSKANKKIIWAVDPFSSDEAILKSAAWCIRALVKGQTISVQPVYAAVYPAYEAPGWPKPDSLEKLRAEGQKAIDQILLRIKIPGIKPLAILPKPGASVRDLTQGLIEYSRKSEAELIVVSSHGRKGLERFLLGSVAETLSLQSDVPLLIVHPNWRRIPEFKTILFPTDFSSESAEAFERVLDFAADRNSRVTLFHKVGAVSFPVFDMAFSAQTVYEQALQSEVAAHERAAKMYVQQGKVRGVRVNVVFDRQRKTTVSEAILKRAKRLGSMIALASYSGRISAALMGSTTRQVVRYSEQPVWVIHPARKARAVRRTA